MKGGKKMPPNNYCIKTSNGVQFSFEVTNLSSYENKQEIDKSANRTIDL